MNLSVGIVGLPNVGKSTLFNALLKRQVANVSNYPFTTIEPNVGVVEVPDDRLPVLAKIVNTQKIVPAVVRFVDIAGLVKGAAAGAGLGNKFLSHIREVDAICHVVRDFSASDVVKTGADPKSDIEVINSELILADLATLEKQPEPRGSAEKEILLRWEVIKKLKLEMNKGVMAKDVSLSEEEKELVRDLCLLTFKPTIYVYNVDEREVKKETDGLVISAKIEAELVELGTEEQKVYLESLGLKKSGLERLIEMAYKTLGLISFLTAGEKEVRAWTIKNGTKAPQAAGVIHTDFEKGFIKAEVVSYDDFVALGGWQKAKEMGKARFEGKEYVMKDGDVVEFKFNL